jgi:protein-histidine pros-kinase
MRQTIQKVKTKMEPNNKHALSAANGELTRKLQLQNELLAHLSHLLSTPINTITKKVEELQEGMYGSFNTEQIDWLRRIYKAARHLQAIVNEISDIVKMTKDKLTIIPVSAREIANTCLRLIDEPANRKHIKTSLILDPSVTASVGWVERMRNPPFLCKTALR